MEKPQILVILGPTASGKSDLAVHLAKKWGGEVVSADSRQVYRGMNLGSGKITKREMLGVPHHLLDVANPKRTFTVAQYQKLASQTIADILKRDKLPILCGGTGFYIQSIVDDLILPEVKPNPKLRKGLEKKSVEELFVILKNLDPKRAKNIDQKNPHRLIRAIEIALELGAVPELKKAKSKFDLLQLGISIDFTKLEERIHTRLLKRLKSGMVKEVQNLKDGGLSWKKLESFGLEYKYIALFLQEKISKSEMMEKIDSESLKYAKRQMTWFKKDKRIVWVKTEKEALNASRKFLD
jgi:tRNA dimethylallyltransferase